MAHNALLSRLDRIALGPPTQPAYERVVDEAATIRMQKVLSYGEDRYNDPDAEHRMLITYSDIYRKSIRLKELMLHHQRSAQDGETLRDTLLDLANYALMGVQLLDAETFAASPEVLARESETVHDSPSEEPQPERLVIDQIAFATHDGAALKELLEDVFGLQDWNEDRVRASGEVRSHPATNQAKLSFSYGMTKDGFEFEVLEPDKAALYWVNKPLIGSEGRPVLSHLGMHVTDLDSHVAKLAGLGYRVVQDVRTIQHSNPKVPPHRKYRYVIFDTRDVLGFDLKLIQRLTVDPAEPEVATAEVAHPE